MTAAAWCPSLGATPGPSGTRFRVWAPWARRVEVELVDGPTHPLAAAERGYHEATLPAVREGARYRYRIDGAGPFPDPASRSQPEGVHGPSEVVDPEAFPWTDTAWPGLSLEELSVYELHVGTFSPEGTFAGAAARLPHLVELGVSAIELMPVADFPGRRNWGYDGVSLFAPARCYGTPDDLRRLVDEAHRLGLGVLLDVVYNHLGPDGNHLGAYGPYFTSRHETPWGDALDFDGETSAEVRAFFAENALRWIREYHADGLRLDATHAIVDDSPRHVLAELAERVRRDAGRPALLVAEDDRNLATMVRPASEGGWGLDAVWADDLHHQLRVRLAGDRDGYFADFEGTSSDVAATLRQGWFYVGQPSAFRGEERGSDPSGIPRERFVVCLQNHDQVGNRAFGDRLHHAIEAPALRAATALLLLAPETPLLFMGQEWGASTPFLYFTDHEPGLGKLVTEGRRREFSRFRAFADPETRARIPDPQATGTFEASRLRWEEPAREPHASLLRLHRALLDLRRREVLPRRSRFEVHAARDGALVVSYGDLHVAVRLDGGGDVELPPTGGAPRIVLATEDPSFCADPRPVTLSQGRGAVAVPLPRPGAVVVVAGD